MVFAIAGDLYWRFDEKRARDLFRSVANEIVSYNAEASKKDQKYRTVEVKVDRPDAKVRTIRGYIP